ncbi:hypothetical protein F0919_10955 [Taibaiella lutea]|uniref:Secreted protein n=1 Tax=Taibaiella lutea TaxID=2608001 RepID=A0A5M6CM96_9BACT|nr:hypothetical protein [Taibaiella lutea]KAA5535102.1 hypothetical protein F0919_10955 [Taibaiella lutea]
MKQFLFTSTLLLCFCFFNNNQCQAQQLEGKDPLTTINLSPFLLPSIPLECRNSMELKLIQIANYKNIGSVSVNPRFIITAAINTLSKNILSTAPTMIALDLEITFFIGDGQQGKIFATTSKYVKGVGTNETKAFMDAIKHIRPEDSALQAFVIEGREHVFDYYKTKCDQVLNEADLLIAANKYKEAVYNLMLVPEECTKCFERCLQRVREIVPQKAHFNCEKLLLKAKAQWVASLDERGADSAAATLALIDEDINPECDKQIKTFITEISSTIKQRNNREWDYKEKSQEAKLDVANEMIKSYRDMASDYAKNNPPPQTYNIEHWIRR